MYEEPKVVVPGLNIEVLDAAPSVIVLVLHREMNISNSCVSGYRLLLY